MRGPAKYHKQSDGSLFSNPIEQTNARLEFIPGSNSSKKYLLQQIPLLGRLEYRTAFAGATIFPDLRSPGSAFALLKLRGSSGPAPKGMD
jgi:hypothetical protein